MGNSLRCCLACVLPCGALDVIRIVHLNGHVEEFGRPVPASEILKANPNHVLSKPSSQGVPRRIVIVSPESDLKRGHIYFLIPSSSFPERKKKKTTQKKKISSSSSPSSKKSMAGKVLDQDNCLVQMLSDISSHRRRKSRRVVLWRPHLESITEDP